MKFIMKKRADYSPVPQGIREPERRFPSASATFWGKADCPPPQQARCAPMCRQKSTCTALSASKPSVRCWQQQSRVYQNSIIILLFSNLKC